MNNINSLFTVIGHNFPTGEGQSVNVTLCRRNSGSARGVFSATVDADGTRVLYRADWLESRSAALARLVRKTISRLNNATVK